MADRPHKNTEETPLFQGMDEQEQVYASQQVGADDTASGVDVVPTTAGSFLPADSGPGVSAETSPVVGSAALADETETNDANDRRTS